MSENQQFDYTNQELISLILKQNGIHEGDWVLAAKLTFSAMNIATLADGSDASPAGVVALTGIRIERVSEPQPFSVNATVVNPK